MPFWRGLYLRGELLILEVNLWEDCSDLKTLREESAQVSILVPGYGCSYKDCSCVQEVSVF